MRPSEILVEMLLDEGPWDWAKQKAANFKQSKLAQHMMITKQPRRDMSPVQLPVTPAGRVTHVAVVYGPNLPQKGYYMTGEGQPQLMAKLKKAMSQKLGNRAIEKDDASIINSWIVNGYQMFLRNDSGQLFYFGEKPHALDQATADVLGAQPTKHMYAQTKAGAAGSMEYPTIS